jgi:acyl transferase domain-containing protein
MSATSDGKEHIRNALKRALIELKQMKAKLKASESLKTEPIAITGMSCRFPGEVATPELFWQLLKEGKETRTNILPNRWDTNSYYSSDANTPGKTYMRHGNFLREIDKFDPQFFGISPREAVSIDPQQRLLLEVVWEALERAGQPPQKLRGTNTGVFVGICTNDYTYAQMKQSSYLENVDAYRASGNAASMASGRIAHVLGLHGPSISINTACSSSLVAVHLACQSLRNGETDLMLAGGVNLILTPDLSIAFSKARMLSSDGRCKTFDATADGFGRGEGCGVVVLKRLSDARQSGDSILALIRGSAVNHDGITSGLTVPNGLAQQAVIRQALKDASLKPNQIDYIEAHGTGTALGDPIEVQALANVFGSDRNTDRPLAIGSVKSNIGHLEAAAGIAGLIKLVLSIQNGQFPPLLHLNRLNPRLNWSQLPVVVPKELSSWLGDNDRPRRAGVSSFGFSGTNAHIILEEASAKSIPASIASNERPLHLLALSAKSLPILQQLATRFAAHLQLNSELSLPDFCFSANAGRDHFEHRLAVIADSPSLLRKKLSSFADNWPSSNCFYGQMRADSRSKIAFLFAPQGSQYINMGKQLYQTQPVFRQAIEECDYLLRNELEEPLLEVLYKEDLAHKCLYRSSYVQPMLFSIEYALAQMWLSWGVQPDFVMGHSVGEYAAACIAGIFKLADGLRLVAARGRLIEQFSPEAGMIAVMAGQKQILKIIKPYGRKASIAAINGPQQVVISGSLGVLDEIKSLLEQTRISYRPVLGSRALNSPLIEPVINEFEKVAQTVEYHEPSLQMISSVTGKMIDRSTILNAKYWRLHIREPVQFEASIQSIVDAGCKTFIDIGSKPTLSRLGKQCIPPGVGTWLPSITEGQDSWQLLLASLSHLYIKGVSIDWAGFDTSYYHRNHLALPTYPFMRESYWFSSKQPNKTNYSKQPVTDDTKQVDTSFIKNHPFFRHSHSSV